LSYIDIAFVCIILIYTFAGMRRGLAVSLISMIRFFIAVPLSYYVSASFSDYVYVNYLKEYFGIYAKNITDDFALIIVKILLFILTFILFYIVTLLIIILLKKLQRVKNMPLKHTNSFLGGVFGLMKAAVLIFVICTFAQYADLIPENSDTREFLNQINSSVIIEYIGGINL